MILLAKLVSIAFALSALVLGETVAIDGAVVTRTSLFGYRVGSEVLDLDEAAQLLALAGPVCDALDPDGDPCEEPAGPQDLLTPPHETFPGFRSETWRKGPAATRRERHLRAALPSVTRRSGRVNKRFSAELGSPRETVDTVEFSYPASNRVPAIEVQ